MLHIMHVNHVSSAVTSCVMQHVLIVPLLMILSTSHVLADQNLYMQDYREDIKVTAALKDVSGSLKCFSDILKEVLHHLKQNRDAVTALGKLPEMVLELKEDVEAFKETSVVDKLKVEGYFQENRDLKTQLVEKDENVGQLERALKTTKEENEKNVLKVEQLVQDLEAQSNETEQQVRKVEQADKNLQTMREDTIKKVNMLNRKINASRIFAEQLIIKEQLEQYNCSKTWSSLRNGLESVLDHNSAAYTQLNNLTNVEGSPLWKSGLRDYVELVTVLLSAGLGANVADKDGDTLLHGAVEGDHVQLAEMLLDHGANTEARGWRYGTPITRLAGNTQLEMIKLLVEHGADVNSQRNDGRTCLYRAAYYGDMDTVKYLVDKGANTTIRRSNGVTPLDIALTEGHTDVVEFLSQQPH